MKWTNWLFGVLGFSAVVVFAILVAGAGFEPYLDIPSAVIILAGGYLPVLMAVGASGLGRAYRAATGEAGRQDCLAAVEVFRQLGRNFVVAGLFGTLMGFIAMLRVEGDSDRLVIGATVAVLTILYALVAVLFLAEPFRARAAAKAAELAD